MPSPVRFRIRGGWRLAATAGVMLTAACTSMTDVGQHPNSPNAGAAAANSLASTAGYAMNSGRGPLPARAAALAATGQTASMITALVAQGTTWHGTVVLRIVVESSDGFGATNKTSSCFRFQFRYPRTSDSGKPMQVACERRQPIDLNHPPLPRGITVATQRTAARVLSRAAAEPPLTSTVAKRDLTRALGSDYTYDLGGEPDQPSTLDGFVRYGEQCLLVHVTGGVSDVRGPFSGNTCFGG